MGEVGMVDERRAGQRKSEVMDMDWKWEETKGLEGFLLQYILNHYTILGVTST